MIALSCKSQLHGILILDIPLPENTSTSSLQDGSPSVLITDACHVYSKRGTKKPCKAVDLWRKQENSEDGTNLIPCEWWHWSLRHIETNAELTKDVIRQAYDMLQRLGPKHCHAFHTMIEANVPMSICQRWKLVNTILKNGTSLYITSKCIWCDVQDLKF